MNRKKLSQALAAPPDSLAGKLVDFLQGNPGERLTRKDIAEKFGANMAMIDSQLAPAVQAKLLVRETDDHDGVTWKLGYPLPTTAQLQPSIAARPVVKRSTAFRVDLDSIKIEKGVPVRHSQRPSAGRVHRGAIRLPRRPAPAGGDGRWMICLDDLLR